MVVSVQMSALDLDFSTSTSSRPWNRNVGIEIFSNSYSEREEGQENSLEIWPVIDFSNSCHELGRTKGRIRTIQI